MNRFQELLCVMFLLHVVGATVTIPVTDSNWYFSDFNWAKGNGFAQTVNPGAYFKVGFTGTSVAIKFDFTGASTSTYSTIRYVIDGANAQQFSLPLPNGATTMQLATSLASSNHTLYVFMKNSLQIVDRWYTPMCVTRVTGLILDDGSKTIAPLLRPKRMLVYWDSIGEGVENLCLPGGDLSSNDATATWAYALAAAMEAEPSMVAFGRLGWTISGNGNVPPVYTPNNDSYSSWNKIDAKHPRSFAGQLDYIVIGHGTNDGLNNRPVAAVAQSLMLWLIAMRQAVSNATSIIVVVPFGGFLRETITDTFKSYMSKTNDQHTFLLDLGEPGSEGLTHFAFGGTWEACDGIHPLVWRDGQLGAMLAVGIDRLLRL